MNSPMDNLNAKPYLQETLRTNNSLQSTHTNNLWNSSTAKPTDKQMNKPVYFCLIAEIIGDPYVKMVPLPRIPSYCDLGQRQNPLSIRNSNIAEWTQARTNLNLLTGKAELMTLQ